MSAAGLILRFSRGSHHYILTNATNEDEFLGLRDGAVIARGRDRYDVARALIIAGTPIKHGDDHVRA